MKIGIMMRAMDQDSGFRAYTEGLVENMLMNDKENRYVLFYRTKKYFGRFSSYPNVKEVFLNAPHKFAWDQISVPYRAWKEKVDIIFNPKFSVPLVSHCPVAMGLQEPAWWTEPAYYPWFNVLYNKTMLPLYCRKASQIFPMSEFILKENRKYLGLPFDDAIVTHTAPGPQFRPIGDAGLLESIPDQACSPGEIHLQSNPRRPSRSGQVQLFFRREEPGHDSQGLLVVPGRNSS